MSPAEPVIDADFGEFSDQVSASRSEEKQSNTGDRPLQTFVERAIDAIVVVDDEGTCITVNASACALLGLSRDTLLGRTITDFAGLDLEIIQLRDTLQTGRSATGELHLRRADGPTRHVDYTATANIAPHNHLIIWRDITHRKQQEITLQHTHAKLNAILNSTNASIASFQLFADRHWEIDYLSAGCEVVFGYTSPELMADKMLWWSRIPPDDQQTIISSVFDHMFAEQQVQMEYRFHHKNGTLRWISSTLIPRYDAATNVWIVTATDIDISDRKQVEIAMQQAMEREQQIREREQFIAAIAQHIRQSLNLEQILTTTVENVRQFLHVDRVLIYRFNADWSGSVIAESLSDASFSIVNHTIHDPCFEETMVYPYRQGRIHMVNDIYSGELNPCYIELLTQLQVRAVLVIPILVQHDLWGLLIAHQCTNPHQWQQMSWHLLRQLSLQVAIGIQQSELYQEVQQLNHDLEHRVQVRTAQLQQALEFEALLKRITDKVRDSLDEHHILQVAVEELGQGLQVDCCSTGIYSSDGTRSTITHEYAIAMASASGYTVQFSELPDLYDQLLNGQCCQCCLTMPHHARPDVDRFSMVACPIFDNQGTLGDLWLLQPREQTFDELKIRLVQQVANQCAIAIRQARLYDAAQTQVKALEQLNRMKDDFLSSVSHELRTPMSNIKMAVQLLEINLTQSGQLSAQSDRTTRYFRILQDECQREITLINDLLDLSRLNLETDSPVVTPINLNAWIPSTVEPFIERAQNRQQHLQIHLPADLPPLRTDASYLSRILIELLTNACKYTPANERIIVSVAVKEGRRRQADGRRRKADAGDSNPHPSCFILRVTNFGVEIAEQERDRIFDKFYRIPNNDPWRHGGTGLGLALVKKLVTHLGGTIQVESGEGETTFILQLPL